MVARIPPAATFARLALALAALAGPACAQRLALRAWSVREGLAHPRVSCLYEDRQGYLWIGTWDGLSRFDGRGFRCYGEQDGLPNPLVWDVAEDAGGNLWFATHGGGVARLVEDPGAPLGRRFVAFPLAPERDANLVSGLAFDCTGRLWCSTSSGVWRATLDASGTPRFERVLPRRVTEGSVHFCLDSAGDLWLVASEAVWAVRGETLERNARPPALVVPEDGELVAVLPRLDGGATIVQQRALFELEALERAAEPAAWARVTLALEPERSLLDAARQPDGALWLASTHGLILLEGGRRTDAGLAAGLPDERVRRLALDRRGGLWIGTSAGGVVRLLDRALVSWGRAEGLGASELVSCVLGAEGELYACTWDGGLLVLRGARLEQLPGSEQAPFRTLHRRLLRDRRGDYWLGTDEGLFRVEGPELDLARAERIGAEQGFEAPGVFHELREDAHGGVWVPGTDGSVYRLEPAGVQPRVERLELPALGGALPARDLLVDSRGALWIGAFVGLWRRSGGELRAIALDAGASVDEAQPRALCEDLDGRLWVGTRFRGLYVCDDPAARAPRFRRLTRADGISGDLVSSLVVDPEGALWIGTSGGLDRLGPGSGELRHWTSADGLAGDGVHHLVLDPRGCLWISTAGGISRLALPLVEARSPPRPMRWRRIVVSGEELPLPERGAERVGPLVLESGDKLELEYDLVGFRTGAPPRFTHLLEGVDETWSAPSERGGLQLARLPTGRLRLLVRALEEGAEARAEPAVLELEVRPPLWRRAWFVALVVGLAGAGTFGLHRLRVRRAVALERLRFEIATDLHDEVGAGLAQIAIQSELARRDAPARGALLGEIAALARSLRGSMADIVWAVDPQRDTLGELLARLRQVACAMLEAEGLQLELRVLGEAHAELELAPDVRRHLSLAFKELVHNVVRHARASRVSIEIEILPGARSLRLSVEDDGQGFTPGATREGQGLPGLRRRAAALGARLSIRSEPGAGTCVELLAPLR